MIYTAHHKPNSLTDKFLEKFSTRRSPRASRQLTTNKTAAAHNEATVALNNTEQLAHAHANSELADGELTNSATLADNLELVQRILSRIEDRLPGRIHKLAVYSTEDAIILAGQCNTFYSKQLAQHVAMGVLDYERLINKIDVRMPQ